MQSILSIVAWFGATVARDSPVVVAVVLTTISYVPTVAWTSLAVTKVSLVVEDVLIATRVLE